MTKACDFIIQGPVGCYLMYEFGSFFVAYALYTYLGGGCSSSPPEESSF